MNGVLGAQTGQVWWYLARAGGIVAWLLLAAGVVCGVLAGSRWSRRLARRAWTVDLHRFLGGLAVVFTLIHVGSILADSYVDIGWVDVVVPFAGSWRPVAVAWGAVALQLLVAVELTSLARRHLPRRVWRGVHLASYPLFALATLHGFTAGSDAGNDLVRLGAALVVGAVVVLTAVRVAESGRSRPVADRPGSVTGVPARSTGPLPPGPPTTPPSWSPPVPAPAPVPGPGPGPGPVPDRQDRP